MVVALVVNPMGLDDGLGSYFFGRYYEYVIGPVVFGGICYQVERKLSLFPKVMLLLLIALNDKFAIERVLDMNEADRSNYEIAEYIQMTISMQ